MSRPREPVDVPSAIRDLAGPVALQPVWRNDLGGLTFRGGDRYFTWQPRTPEFTLIGEAARMRWAASWTPVPTVLDVGGDDDHEWLVTSAMDGESAVAPRWLDDPGTAAFAVGRGLRALHDALPVVGCPFSWSVPERIDNARRRGLDVPAALENRPPVDLLVVCHGDACCPNTLLDPSGPWSGHVDLTHLGVADRWADLAAAALSTAWNYGADRTDTVLAGYGVDRDVDRLDYYQRLWQAC